MAKTFIGQLIFRLKTEGQGEAGKVLRTMEDINRKARELGQSSNAGWGAGFAKQLIQLKANAREMAAIQRSWSVLHADMDRKNLTAALRKSDISMWKTATVSHLAAVRAQANDTERQIASLRRTLGYGLRPGMVMLGGYTAGYMGGVMGREALTAASNERRVHAEAKYAGLSEDERGRIGKRAGELSSKYRLSEAGIFEVMKEASLSMPSTDAALAVSEEMAQAYLVLSNSLGPEGAMAGLRQFNKAMDNVEKVTPEEYKYGLENYMKAQHVIGRDIDPTAFAEAIKFSRTAGKVFGDEFTFQWLPMLIAESGGADAGTQLRAAFDQFIVGRASKKSLKEQERLGLREADGRLLNQEKFTENPLTWVWDTLLPTLKKQGVDTENETELARIIGGLTNNRLSSDLILRAILSMQSYRRLVEERLPNAAGLDAANSIQTDNPFAAWEGFKSSLENLAAASLPMPTITSGLNSLADAINAFQKRIREGDPTVTYGAAATAGLAGIWLTAKTTAAVTGLVTAGTNLNVAAVALQRAAAMQAGAGILDGAPGGRGLGKLGALGFLGFNLPTLLTALSAIGIREVIEELSTANAADQRGAAPRDYSDQYGAAENADNNYRQWHGVPFEGGMHRAGRGAGPQPGVESFIADLDRLRTQAIDTGNEVQNSLGVTVTPQIDSSSLDLLLGKVRAVASELAQLGVSSGNAENKLHRQMGRNMADHGVTPWGI